MVAEPTSRSREMSSLLRVSVLFNMAMLSGFVSHTFDSVQVDTLHPRQSQQWFLLLPILSIHFGHFLVCQLR